MLTSQNNAHRVDIGHHRRKWKSPILGVARIVLCDVFFASFFAYVEPKLFSHFRAGKFSSAAPNLVTITV